MTEEKPLTGWHPKAGERERVQLPRLKPAKRKAPYRPKSDEERAFEEKQVHNRRRTRREALDEIKKYGAGKHRKKKGK